MKLYAKWIRTSGPPLAESIKRTESLTWCGGLPVPSAKAIRSGILILLLTGCQTPVTPPVSSPPLPPAVSPRRPMAATAAQPAPIPMTSATVNWMQPDTNRVAGFRIYLGVQSGTYTNVLIAGFSDRSLTIPGLLIGTNYVFAATAFGPQGQESDYSNEFAWLAKANPKIIVITIQGSDDLLQYTNIVSWTNLPSASHEFYRSVTTRY